MYGNLHNYDLQEAYGNNQILLWRFQISDSSTSGFHVFTALSKYPYYIRGSGPTEIQFKSHNGMKIRKISKILAFAEFVQCKLKF